MSHFATLKENSVNKRAPKRRDSARQEGVADDNNSEMSAAEDNADNTEVESQVTAGDLADADAGLGSVEEKEEVASVKDAAGDDADTAGVELQATVGNLADAAELGSAEEREDVADEGHDSEFSSFSESSMDKSTSEGEASDNIRVQEDASTTEDDGAALYGLSPYLRHIRCGTGRGRPARSAYRGSDKKK